MINSDICVIGAGSAGLSVASGAAQLGLNVVLIEKDKMGGDCLNTGCVPSKSLLAAAKAAKSMQKAYAFGIRTESNNSITDYNAVKDHVRTVIDRIAPHDSQERFEGLGVQVIRNEATFIDSKTLKVGNKFIRARHFVIATGSSALIPLIKGLEAIRYHTNESIFTLEALPEHLLIIGGGPIGIEMAQAHKRLGANVSLFDKGFILPKDDPEAVAILREALLNDGIMLYENTAIDSLTTEGESIRLNHSTGHATGSHLLVATGRKANVKGLGLDAANITYDTHGITTDEGLRSLSNKRVWALGDVAAGPQFTHVASYHASLFIRRALFRLPAKQDYSALPWVTYTDPELAQVGITEPMAQTKGLPYRSKIWHFANNNRALAERNTKGFVKILYDKHNRVLGATIIGPGAGELIQTWGLAIQNKIPLQKIASMIAPYPSLSEINKQVAGSAFTSKLFSKRTQNLVRFLSRLP